MEVTYATNRLLLKNLDKGSAQSVLDFYQRNHLHFEPWESLRPQNFYTINYQKTLLIAERTIKKRAQAMRYYLFEKSNPSTIIGTVNFYHILPSPDRTCKLGYKLDYSYVHKGYAYEALTFLIPKVFCAFNLYRIEADVMKENLPSIRLLKRLHFRYEDTKRQSFEINGSLKDHLRYALLRNEVY